MKPDDIARKPPSFAEALRFWGKLGFINFGGPAGQIALMHAELVDRRRWVSEAQFLHALNFCMLLPGPEAQQLATYLGWLLHGTRGGLAAGIFFVLPSFFLLVALSWAYVAFGTLPLLAALFSGLKAAVLAIIAAALLRLGRRALQSVPLAVVALLAFLGLHSIGLPFPLIILLSGAVGVLGSRWHPDWFPTGEGPAPEAGLSPAPHTLPHPGRALRVLGTCLGLWAGGMLALLAWRGSDDVLFRQAVFFSKAALVTFGGAYAVLPYIAQAGVETFHWLQPHQMIDGLGLAETTPGPLIMVVAYVAFLGAWNHPGSLSPALAGAFGAAVATYFTFLPSFLWIFLGAPYVERGRRVVPLRAGLSAITAAVVGVILNLALYFGEAVLFPPGRAFDVFSAGLAMALFACLQSGKWSVSAAVATGTAAGIVRGALFAP